MGASRRVEVVRRRPARELEFTRTVADGVDGHGKEFQIFRLRCVARATETMDVMVASESVETDGVPFIIPDIEAAGQKMDGLLTIAFPLITLGDDVLALSSPGAMFWAVALAVHVEESAVLGAVLGPVADGADGRRGDGDGEDAADSPS